MDRADEPVVALSGGTGSAKFLRGLQQLTRFAVVANVGDNSWFHGLYVCPDIDTVTYTLAGVADSKRGWGIEGDDFSVLGQLKRLGARDTWFNIGDLDLATDILRTALMREGWTLTEVTSLIAEKLGVRGCTILPATDQHVETRVRTADREDLHLQEFWVKAKGKPTPKGVRYVGARSARPGARARKAIARAERIILCPANPITSILPTLAIPGFRSALRESRARRVAVSPMIGEGAFSGPAAGLMASRGLKPNSESVARLYKGLIDVLVLDEGDRRQEEAIERAGVSCAFTSTLMGSREDEERLAKVAMEA